VNGLSFRQIEYDSADYAAECALRHKVLRQPLGLDLYAEDLEAERSHRHYGIFDRDRIVACAVVVDGSDRSVRLRQMAVATGRRRTGLGTRLITQIESLMCARQVQQIVVHARIEAVPFYRQLGFRVKSRHPFMEVGIPHLAMEKNLSEPPGCATEIRPRSSP